MPAVEEVLYPAMEDFQLDLMIGEGPAARSIRIDLPPFTLVGATTRAGLVTRPLRERFGIPLRLEFYNPAELQLIISRGARLLDLALTETGSAEIARRSRGTPRVAGRLLRRVRDFAAVDGLAQVDAKAADAALNRLEVDGRGLDAMDRRYLGAHCTALFRRSGWGRDDGGRPFGTARRYRRRDRALSHPARLPAAHAARTAADRRRLHPSGIADIETGGHTVRSAEHPARARGCALRPGASSGALEGRRHLIDLRVHYAQTDAGGVVYHAQYLVFAEHARTEFLRLIGWPFDRLQRDHGLTWLVRHASLDLRKPARLDDAITVETALLGDLRRQH